jgi:hypothetical protein
MSSAVAALSHAPHSLHILLFCKLVHFTEYHISAEDYARAMWAELTMVGLQKSILL